jgi:hypothetical protein
LVWRTKGSLGPDLGFFGWIHRKILALGAVLTGQGHLGPQGAASRRYTGLGGRREPCAYQGISSFNRDIGGIR